MAITVPERWVISAAGTRVGSIDCSRELKKIGTNAVLTGTPTCVELGKVTFDDDGLPVYTASALLTIVNKVVNTSDIELRSRGVVLAGHAVQMKVTPALLAKGFTFGIRVTVLTDTGPETLVFDQLVDVV